MAKKDKYRGGVGITKKDVQTEEITRVGDVEVAPTTADTLYALGAKKYAPKAGKNERTWGIIQAQLQTGHKTLKQLQEACVYEVDGQKVHHVDMVGYMVRGGHLAPVVAE